MTSTGIETATCPLAAQYRNQLRVPAEKIKKLMK
jgi:hypothetical protein